MRFVFWPFFTAQSTELSSLHKSASSAAPSPLTSFDVMFSKSFCIIISLNLVLISRSVRSRSVGLSEGSKRVTRRGNKLDSQHLLNGVSDTPPHPPSMSSAGGNSGDCKSQFRFPLVYERDQMNAPNPLQSSREPLVFGKI